MEKSCTVDFANGNANDSVISEVHSKSEFIACQRTNEIALRTKPKNTTLYYLLKPIKVMCY